MVSTERCSILNNRSFDLIPHIALSYLLFGVEVLFTKSQEETHHCLRESNRIPCDIRALYSTDRD